MIVDLMPAQPESYVKNCIIKSDPDRQDSMYLEVTSENVVIRLDGYAIIPCEEYYELVNRVGGSC